MIEPLSKTVSTATDTLISQDVPVLGTPEAASVEPRGVVGDYLRIGATARERLAVRQLEAVRPAPHRAFDQISMIGEDLLRQVKLVAPFLAARTVAFVGDLDGTSLLLGALGELGMPLPTRMLVADFDARLLRAAEAFAREHGFADRLDTVHYNVFDPLPCDLVGQFEWFYTNPPYGQYNDGASAHLFIARGCELVDPYAGSGCIILPYDTERRWTRRASWATEGFLNRAGWAVRAKIDRLHRYDLDDDRALTSALILVDRVKEGTDEGVAMPYRGRAVPQDEIPRFYGRSVPTPYPRYIRADGTLDVAWPQSQGTAA